jgi:hypothetical protein
VNKEREECMRLTDFDGNVVPFSAPLSAKVKPQALRPSVESGRR